MLFTFLSLLACSGDKTDKDDPVVDSFGSSELDVADYLDQAGFAVQKGAFVFSPMDGCCDPGANCYGNNVSTPYGTHALPPAPGEVFTAEEILASWGPAPEGMRRTFKLRQDEAILLVGPPPPRAAYLGYRAYLGTPAGSEVPYLASLGAPLNNQFYPDVFDETWIMVTSFDQAVEQLVLDQVSKAGIEGMIFRDRITTEVVTPGLGANGDSFFSALRVALYDDPVAGEAFVADPGFDVWRLTPRTPMSTTQPFARDDLNERGAGNDEEAWRPAVDALEQNLESWIADNHGDPVTFKQLVHPHVRETYDCIDDPTQICTGELLDRWVAPTASFVLGADDFMIGFGVNHRATGKATYSNLSIQTILNQVGIASFASDEMVGSASSFSDSPLVDDLYVTFFARDCGSLPTPCFEVPTDQCPGAPLNEQLKISARAYLEPSTGAAPVGEEMVLDRVIKVFGGLQ